MPEVRRTSAPPTCGSTAARTTMPVSGVLPLTPRSHFRPCSFRFRRRRIRAFRIASLAVRPSTWWRPCRMGGSRSGRIRVGKSAPGTTSSSNTSIKDCATNWSATCRRSAATFHAALDTPFRQLCTRGDLRIERRAGPACAIWARALRYVTSTSRAWM